MKSILNLLATAMLTSTPTIPFLANIEAINTFSDGNLEVNVPPINVSHKDLSNSDRITLGQMSFDLTAYSGIYSVKEFKSIYQSIELSKFKVEMSLMTKTEINPEPFKINTKLWPDSGSIYMEPYTWFSAQERDSKNPGTGPYVRGYIDASYQLSYNTTVKHIVFHVVFYGHGGYRATNSRPWCNLQSGDILKFVSS